MSKRIILNMLLSIILIALYMIILFRILLTYDGFDSFITATAFIILILLTINLMRRQMQELESKKDE